MGCETSKQPFSEVMKKTPTNNLHTDGSRTIRFSAKDMIGKRDLDFYKEYTYVKDLGHGTFGEVVEAVHNKSNISRAVKMLENRAMSSQEKEEVFREIEILKELDHPNIMRIFEYFENKDFVFIVGEVYTGGELFEKIIQNKHFTEKDAANTMKQILSAVNYCHKKGIVHRDLKPQNILLESTDPAANIKIVDFGVSAVVEPNKNLYRATGTPLFMAPEVLKKNYNQKCDIWSCGVILYMLLSGQIPFKGRTKQAILAQIQEGAYDLKGKEWEHISERAKNFVKKLMEYNPEDRYSAEQALADPWITEMVHEEKNSVLTEHALSNLRSYRAEKKLQEAFWLFISSYFARKEDKNEFLKVFQALDTNGDGTLTKNELLKGFKEVSKYGFKKSDIEHILKVADTNGNGVIDYSEFIAATLSKNFMLEQNRLETAFKMFDKDGNGFLTLEEIKELVNPEDKSIDDNDWQKLMKEVDQNGDEKISYNEFRDLILRVVNNGEK